MPAKSFRPALIAAVILTASAYAPQAVAQPVRFLLQILEDIGMAASRAGIGQELQLASKVQLGAAVVEKRALAESFIDIYKFDPDRSARVAGVIDTLRLSKLDEISGIAGSPTRTNEHLFDWHPRLAQPSPQSVSPTPDDTAAIWQRLRAGHPSLDAPLGTTSEPLPSLRALLDHQPPPTVTPDVPPPVQATDDVSKLWTFELGSGRLERKTPLVICSIGSKCDLTFQSLDVYKRSGQVAAGATAAGLCLTDDCLGKLHNFAGHLLQTANVAPSAAAAPPPINPPAPRVRWAAVERDDTDKFYAVFDEDSEPQAIAEAGENCRKDVGAGRCNYVRSLANACFALARASGRWWSWAIRDSVDAARGSAMSDCTANRFDCAITWSWCADGSNRYAR